MPKNKNALLDYLLEKLKLKNDLALCKALGLSPPIISKIRNGQKKATDGVLIVMHEVSGTSVKALRFLNQDFRESTLKDAPVLTKIEVKAYLEHNGISHFP